MLDIPSGVHQDPPQPPDTPDSHIDTGAITEACGLIAVARYQAGMGYADIPEQVYRAYGIMEQELRRLDALPTCSPTTLVPVRPILKWEDVSDEKLGLVQ